MDKGRNIVNQFIRFGIGVPLITNLLILPVAFMIGEFAMVLLVVIPVWLYKKWKDKIDESIIIINFVWILLILVSFIICVYLGNGGVQTTVMNAITYVMFPYFITTFLAALTDSIALGVVYAIVGLLTGFVMSLMLCKEKRFGRNIIIVGFFVIAVLSAYCVNLYLNRSEVKYAGHGFDYMYGYSSTDFTDYHVYSDPSKLVSLDHEPELQITENYPVMDGAEACYPLYAAIAKELYADIARIEEESDDYRSEEYYHVNGKYVSFTNTVDGFERLILKEVDMFFGAKPSKSQMEAAESAGVELEITPIGKEGFVFFVEEDNPVENITSEQLKAIYHGDIINWKEVGGKNQKIIAFQRPENSGSQTMMQYFMGDVSLKEPMTYELVLSMGGTIEEVADYANEDGALGYTFRYFLEGLNQEKGVKMLAIDGVHPTRENITDGSYPLTTNLCLVTRKGNTNENVEKVKEFILSEDGQYMVEETGYSRLKVDGN